MFNVATILKMIYYCKVLFYSFFTSYVSIFCNLVWINYMIYEQVKDVLKFLKYSKENWTKISWASGKI